MGSLSKIVPLFRRPKSSTSPFSGNDSGQIELILMWNKGIAQCILFLSVLFSPRSLNASLFHVTRECGEFIVPSRSISAIVGIFLCQRIDDGFVRDSTFRGECFQTTRGQFPNFRSRMDFWSMPNFDHDKLKF